MESTDECGDHMAVLRVVAVAWAIKVGRHDAAVVHPMGVAILAVVTLTQLDASDFGNGIGLIGGL